MSKSLAFLIGCESDVVMWGKRQGSCTVEGNAVDVNAMEVDAPEVDVSVLDDSFDERRNHRESISAVSYDCRPSRPLTVISNIISNTCFPDFRHLHFS